MLEFTADDLSQLLARVREALRAWGTDEVDAEVWFRGVGCSRYGLVPGIYRPENAGLQEENIFYRFQTMASSRLERPLEKEWEWYFIAQHHGLPTRLLDWTENLFVAAYFAVEQCAQKKTLREVIGEAESPEGNAVREDSTPTIWMMDANDLNRASVGDGQSFIPDGPFTANWLPAAVHTGKPRTIETDEGTVTNERPIALLPPRVGHRLIAQQGVFTIHGTGTQPLEAYYGNTEGERLARICIAPNRQAAMWRDLHTCGVHRFAVFPDLSDLALHLKHALR